MSEELLQVDREEMFSVRHDNEANAHYLDVVCGGIAMFERRLTLNAEETNWLRNDPQQFRTLVQQVRKWPERFQGRISPV